MNDAAARVAYLGATPALEAKLRAAYLGGRGVGYAGREFRAYAHMRVGEAVRFYAAIHHAWRAERLAEDLRLAGLGEQFEIGRLRRSYQRTLVLALASAADPELLVVEGAEEFDDETSGKLLSIAFARSARAILSTAGGEVPAGIEATIVRAGAETLPAARA